MRTANAKWEWEAMRRSEKKKRHNGDCGPTTKGFEQFGQPMHAVDSRKC